MVVAAALVANSPIITATRPKIFPFIVAPANASRSIPVHARRLTLSYGVEVNSLDSEARFMIDTHVDARLLLPTPPRGPR